jgi:hypothetical protein
MAGNVPRKLIVKAHLSTTSLYLTAVLKLALTEDDVCAMPSFFER